MHSSNRAAGRSAGAGGGVDEALVAATAQELVPAAAQELVAALIHAPEATAALQQELAPAAAQELVAAATTWELPAAST